nr:helix-turn-helix transcriptional regulator [Burkholderia dolosa]
MKEERERLGLNQTKFGELGGVSKKAQIDYEKDVFSPNARYLEAVAKGGVDVLYVLTGARTPTAAASLSREEEALVDNYRHSSPEDQAAMRRTATALAEPKKHKSRNGSTG